MRSLILALAVAFCTLDRAAADPAEDALRAKAETCLRSAAPEVAGKAENITDALYALKMLCAVEIARAGAYEANARTLADWQTRLPAQQLVGVALDPITGELKTPPGFRVESDSTSIELHYMTRATLADEFEAVAAQAVIAARHPVKGP